MQVIETNTDGLKRELKITIGAEELDNKLLEKLEELKDKVNIKGFRPGKVPVAHLRRVYGRSVMAEVVQQAVTEASDKAISERELRPAFEPDIAFTEDQDEIEEILSGKADLIYTLSFEILPKIEIADLSSIKLEKEMAEVEDKDVQDGLNRLAKNNVTYIKKDGTAEEGDQITIDFVGKIDGEPFEGGSAEDAPVVIGQNAFIPGFEDGLIGAKAGEERSLDITFPEKYPAEKLAGQAATFEVKVKEVGTPVLPEINDEFSKMLGMETLDELKKAISKQIQEDYDSTAKAKLKRKLLDILDEKHQFDPPPKLIEQEFEAVWQKVKQDLERAERTFEDEDTTEEAAREEYQKVAERRVRLGLVMSEIGEKNEIKVTDEEVRRSLMDYIQNFPGQEKEVLEFYQKNPQALAQLRAPIYEEKVTDFILELADVTEKTVSLEELLESPDDDDKDKEAKESKE